MSPMKRRSFATLAIFCDPITVLAILPLFIIGFIALVSFVHGCIRVVPP
jgi:hypothetical protein